jgi:hypothetical protein
MNEVDNELSADTLAFLQQRSRSRRTADVSENIRLITQWTRDGLELDNETHISVTELQCADPSCPVRETVIAVFTTPVRHWKIGKAVVYVRKYDVAMALERTNGDAVVRPHQ